MVGSPSCDFIFPLSEEVGETNNVVSSACCSPIPEPGHSRRFSSSEPQSEVVENGAICTGRGPEQ